MKFEVVITVWDDGLFRLRDRIEFEYDGATYPNLEDITDKMVHKIQEEKDRWKRIAEDDDIPF